MPRRWWKIGKRFTIGNITVLKLRILGFIWQIVNKCYYRNSLEVGPRSVTQRFLGGLLIEGLAASLIVGRTLTPLLHTRIGLATPIYNAASINCFPRDVPTILFNNILPYIKKIIATKLLHCTWLNLSLLFSKHNFCKLMKNTCHAWINPLIEL